jgi:hypothetical protein
MTIRFIECDYRQTEKKKARRNALRPPTWREQIGEPNGLRMDKNSPPATSAMYPLRTQRQGQWATPKIEQAVCLIEKRPASDQRAGASYTLAIHAAGGRT